MTHLYDIHKAGGAIIRDRHLLVTRSAGKDIFIAPGGKLEEEESVLEALAREMNEELQIFVDTSTAEPIGSFYSIAAGKTDKKLRMDMFIINDYQGEIAPSNEVEEIRWINSVTEGIEIGSILVHDVMPLLKQRDLID